MYVFDTDVLSLLMKGRLADAAADRMSAVAARASTTAVNLGELLYGAARSAAAARWLRLIEQHVLGLPILPFDAAAAQHYAEIRVALERRGESLDDGDLRIAAICIARDRILISRNPRHFGRVPGLRHENWVDAP